MWSQYFQELSCEETHTFLPTSIVYIRWKIGGGDVEFSHSRQQIKTVALKEPFSLSKCRRIYFTPTRYVYVFPCVFEKPATLVSIRNIFVKYRMQRRFRLTLVQASKQVPFETNQSSCQYGKPFHVVPCKP